MGYHLWPDPGLGTRLTPTEQDVLQAALRAPSPQNAQPWRIIRVAENHFRVLYAHADRLRSDPGDRNAYLAFGGFLESLRLRAGELGLAAEFRPSFQPVSEGVTIGHVRLTPGRPQGDPLAGLLEARRTNRHPYQRQPLPADLERDLRGLGCLFVDPDEMAALSARAGALAWRDRSFTHDLERWTRFEERSADGISCRCLRLNPVQQQFLRLGFRMGSLPAPLARLYAAREVRLTRRSGAVAVLTAPDLEPLSLLDAGRRLLRSWLTITAYDHASHPISAVVDQETRDELAGRLGQKLPVAAFRVGYTDRPAAPSPRRELAAVILED